VVQTGPPTRGILSLEGLFRKACQLSTPKEPTYFFLSIFRLLFRSNFSLDLRTL